MKRVKRMFVFLCILFLGFTVDADAVHAVESKSYLALFDYRGERIEPNSMYAIYDGKLTKQKLVLKGKIYRIKKRGTPNEKYIEMRRGKRVFKIAKKCYFGIADGNGVHKISKKKARGLFRRGLKLYGVGIKFKVKNKKVTSIIYTS